MCLHSSAQALFTGWRESYVSSGAQSAQCTCSTVPAVLAGNAASCITVGGYAMSYIPTRVQKHNASCTVQWLTYWIIFALLQTVETFGYWFLLWCARPRVRQRSSACIPQCA